MIKWFKGLSDAIGVYFQVWRKLIFLSRVLDLFCSWEWRVIWTPQTVRRQYTLKWDIFWKLGGSETTKKASEGRWFVLSGPGRAAAGDCRVCRLGSRLAGAGAGVGQQGRGGGCAGSRKIPAVLSAGAVGSASSPGCLWQLFNVLIVLLIWGD